MDFLGGNCVVNYRFVVTIPRYFPEVFYGGDGEDGTGEHERTVEYDFNSGEARH